MRPIASAVALCSAGALGSPLAIERQATNVLVSEDDKKNLDRIQKDHLPTVNWRSFAWSSEWIPEGCAQVSTAFKNTEWDIWDVIYDDCLGSPFVICKHRKSEISEQDLFWEISRLPVRMRQYVANFAAVPNGTVYTAWTYGYIVGAQAQTWVSQGALAHELSHVLDDKVLRTAQEPNVPFSNATAFRNAVAQDAFWASDYGKNNPINEEFAEIGRLSIFNKHVPGGLTGAGFNPAPISRQLSVYNTAVGDKNQRGGLCTADKVQSTRPIRKDGTGRGSQPMPDISNTGNIVPDLGGTLYHQ